MPELPEVETTRRGIAPLLAGETIRRVDVRQRQLRWPVPATLEDNLPGEVVTAITRRAKYLLLHTAPGCALLHLGMSGSLHVLGAGVAPDKHDHVDIAFDNGRILRLNDPRRFGSLLWQPAGSTHPLLAGLGPEPLEGGFDGSYLWQRARGRRVAVKNFLMDNRIVVGVGNIYASEALFAAGIHPRRAAGRIARARYERLAEAVQRVLQQAIRSGGTSLRDFAQPDGQPGYFEQELQVYGRAGQPCPSCGQAIRSAVIGQRNTFWCAHCQH